jgi:hypothetical protein
MGFFFKHPTWHPELQCRVVAVFKITDDSVGILIPELDVVNMRGAIAMAEAEVEFPMTVVILNSAGLSHTYRQESGVWESERGPHP